MNKLYKKAKFIGVLATVAVVLYGCGSKSQPFEPQLSSMYIGKDGMIKSAAIENQALLGSKEGLEAFVQAELQGFNTTQGEGSVTLTTVEANETMTKVELSYADIQSFVKYSQEDGDDSLRIESMEVGTKDSLPNLPEMVKSKAGKSQVVAISGNAHVYTEGKIVMYASVDSELPTISDHELEITGDGVKYIVIK